MPQARKNTLQALARAVLENPAWLSPAISTEEAVRQLRSIPGVGEWTAQYIALRALRESDAFPASDVGILRGAARLEGSAVTARDVLARAEAWRPWRGYAAQYLWTLSGEASAHA
jgi:3-methyladenine DNA glycosylase/8-oxoguanine DNA glycosylase